MIFRFHPAHPRTRLRIVIASSMCIDECAAKIMKGDVTGDHDATPLQRGVDGGLYPAVPRLLDRLVRAIWMDCVSDVLRRLWRRHFVAAGTQVAQLHESGLHRPGTVLCLRRPCPRATKTCLRQLFGTLRHVATCCRSAKPFYQRVQRLCIAAPPVGTVALNENVREHLKWCATLLRVSQFNGLPTTMFGACSAPDVHFYIDASDDG